jgi:hypothetical protein
MSQYEGRQWMVDPECPWWVQLRRAESLIDQISGHQQERANSALEMVARAAGMTRYHGMPSQTPLLALGSGRDPTSSPACFGPRSTGGQGFEAAFPTFLSSAIECFCC